MLHIGTVPWLVAKPLTAGLECHEHVQLHMAEPAVLIQKLHEGSLDIALASTVACFGESGLNRLEQGPVIACDGPVQSVALFLREGLSNPSHIQTWVSDPASRSGQMLARILLRDSFECSQPVEIPCDPQQDPFSIEADAVLRIGDPALRAPMEHPHRVMVDLGQAWKELTGLPFVFAAWIARPGFDPELARNVLSKAASTGTATIPEISQQDVAFPTIDRERYLRDHLRYSLPEETTLKVLQEFEMRSNESAAC